MPWLRCALAMCGVCLAGAAWAQEPGTRTLSAKELAAEIDRRLAVKWKEAEPAPRADDAEFLRRVYLDLAGRIPRVWEVREFLGDTASNKRDRLIDRLLDGPQYVNHLGNTWRTIILPPTNNQQFQFINPGFKTWVEQQVRNNTPYDRMVREILSATQFNRGPNGQPVFVQPGGPSPVAFMQANENKPENLASSTARVFLGVRLECAQCHDHPFATWTRAQFWETAAFFSAVQPQQFQRVVGGQAPAPKLPRGKIKIQGTDKVVQARFLTGELMEDIDKTDPQLALAEWVTAPGNPYFARTGANRLWAHFFGLGIADPVDDEATEENPASHPELLKELSQQFVAHRFDIKYMMRAIAGSQAYQRTSVQTHASQADPRLFARMSVRGLTPEQFFDSLALAVGYRNSTNPQQQQFGLVPGNPRNDFLTRFASQEAKTEKQFSILQALALMNGKFVADATSVQGGTTLAAVVDAPFLNNGQKVETLFLATLGRFPRAEESRRLVAYVEQGGSRQDSATALADVFWVLLNCSEFSLNH